MRPVSSLQSAADQRYTWISNPGGVPRRVVFSSSGDLNRAQRTLKAAAESLFAVLFPCDCKICRSPLTNISTLPVCPDCLEQVAPLSGILCRFCGEKLISQYVETEAGPVCGLCRRAAPPFARAVAFGAYDGHLRELIHLLKYQKILPVAKRLGRYLDVALAGVELPESLTVVPVPLHQARRRSRGFNQAEEIAKAFACCCRAATRIKIDTASLARVRETASQTGLTRHQRRANLRGAFAVTRPEQIRERSILLVDDVMTTGTTAAACARVLLRVGAKQVFVATAARAIKEVEIRLEEQQVWAKAAPA